VTINPGLRANMVISAQSGNATGALQPALVEGRAGAAAAAHNLRMRSVS